MLRNSRCIPIFILNFLFVSCNNAPKETKSESNIDVFQWILGDWVQSITDTTMIYNEKWEKLNDSTYTASSEMMNGSDTLFSESVQLKTRASDAPVYSTTIHEGKSLHRVDFILVESGDKKAVFENKENDFPQRVIYFKSGSDSLIAITNGTENGLFKEQYFSMGRKK
jgi:hypothetical protein